MRVGFEIRAVAETVVWLDPEEFAGCTTEAAAQMILKSLPDPDHVFWDTADIFAAAEVVSAAA